MTEIRMVFITFNLKIEPWEVEQFRGAIIRKVGIEHEWFHNHNNSQEAKVKFHYRYPLIQYRYHQGSPQIVCVQECVEEIQHLFAQPNWDIDLKGRTESLGIKEMEVKKVRLEQTEQPQHYQLQHWLPFNSANFEAYRKMEYEVERLQMLESILTGHILGLFEGLSYEASAPLQVRIKRLVKHKFVTYKGAKMMAFNLDFSVHARLPYYVGLGKGASLGFGYLCPFKRERKEQS